MLAVRTPKGISLLHVDGDLDGLVRAPIHVQGMGPSGTAFLRFEDCLVPYDRLLGDEGKGFALITSNFNHERWAFAVMSSRLCKLVYGACMHLDSPVVAEMGREISAFDAWLEQVTALRPTVEPVALGGTCALLKVHGSKVLERCAVLASELGVRGELLDRVWRDVRGHAIPGGSEEILLDLGVRQATRAWAKL